MNFFSWTLRIIAGSFLMVWLPMLSFAFTPGAFVVSPAEIDLGTVTSSSNGSNEDNEEDNATDPTYVFTIHIFDGPEAEPDNEKESPVFYATCDASWLTLDTVEGTAPGKITATATVSETMGSGVWTANVTIVSGLDPDTEPV
ncbi:MAG: hypothetical protein ACQETR_16680, partial [Thermodesulfobacteriota bacterium]